MTLFLQGDQKKGLLEIQELIPFEFKKKEEVSPIEMEITLQKGYDQYLHYLDSGDSFDLMSAVKILEPLHIPVLFQ